jgi:predicted DNA-binding transcriptional regulator AlpA
MELHAVSNANKTRGISGSPPPVAWVEAEIDAWIRARIKGAPYQPPPLGEQPVVLIRKPEVLRRTGLSHVGIWRLEKQGKFPKRVQLSDRQEIADAA